MEENAFSTLDTMSALIALTFALDYDPSNSEALNLSAILFPLLVLHRKPSPVNCSKS